MYVYKIIVVFELIMVNQFIVLCCFVIDKIIFLFGNIYIFYQMYDMNCSFLDFKFVEEKSNNFNIKLILFKW